jgi:carboxylate-amine ligase
MDLEFAASPRSSVGVEWELMLADPATGELVPRAPEVLDLLGPDVLGITGELLTNTIEVMSDPHARVADAIADVRDRILTVRTVTDSLGIALLSAGSHPFANWQDQSVTDKSRYHTLVERTQWWGRNMLIWGNHVHVGIDDRAKAIPILEALTTYLPHFLALSASSPYWAGEATGYASNRSLVFQQLPTAGLPWHTGDWAGFERFVADLAHTGVIDDVTEVRWDIRPAPRWGTVEIRVFDAVARLTDLGVLAALSQCLVERLSRRIDAGEELDVLPPWFWRENKWRAARYGLDAILITDSAANEQHVVDHLAELLDELAPIAVDLDCAAELAGVVDLIAGGAGYRGQVDAARSADGDLGAVIRHLADEFSDSLAVMPGQEFLSSRQARKS